MRKLRILKQLEVLLIVITFFCNFSPVIYHQFVDSPSPTKVLFRSCRYFDLNARIRNCGISLLVVTISEAGQLIWRNKR